jgi:ubiquinone/menaquinone biosynthesis C-methylase UbiE
MTKIDEKELDELGILEWYDFIGILADALPALHLGGAEATRDLIEMLELGPEDSVLDVGCGAGQTACEIAKEFGSRVTGVDISDVMISKAMDKAIKQRVEDKVEFRVADAFQLPFDDESFDIALFESVLTPLPGNKMDALRETIRVV